MSFYNPFFGIIETNIFLHARTLRTSLFHKILDAFFIFSGTYVLFPSWKGKHRTEHIGICDYATLFIPYALLMLTIQIGNFLKANTLPQPIELLIRIVLSILLFPLLALKYVVSAILTIISLPVIIAVHGISLITANDLKERVLQLKIRRVRHLPEGHDSYTENSVLRTEKWIDTYAETLGDYLKNNDIDLEDLTMIKDIENIAINASPDEDKTLKVTFSTHEGNRCQCCGYSNQTFVYETVFSKSDAASKKDFQEILALNIGNVTGTLENDFPNLLHFLTSSVLNCGK